MRRTTPLLLLPILLAALAGGCADDAETADDARTSASATTPTGVPSGSASPATVTGTLTPYTEGATAVTYDPAVAPAGGEIQATLTPVNGGVTVQLAVRRLLPGRGYGAHVHTSPCGAAGAAAGPHYQHSPDPAASASPPSVDPGYANPDNEVWLDFTTDATGAATATATHTWTFTGEPRAVVIHAETTKTAPGQAGTAGARVACLTLPKTG